MPMSNFPLYPRILVENSATISVTYPSPVHFLTNCVSKCGTFGLQMSSLGWTGQRQPTCASPRHSHPEATPRLHTTCSVVKGSVPEVVMFSTGSLTRVAESAHEASGVSGRRLAGFLLFAFRAIWGRQVRGWRKGWPLFRLQGPNWAP